MRLRDAASGTTIALLLIFLAILWLSNEVRFQGCVQRQDNADLINATAHQATNVGPACHRIPFR